MRDPFRMIFVLLMTGTPLLDVSTKYNHVLDSMRNASNQSIGARWMIHSEIRNGNAGPVIHPMEYV
jgi:hypothetical protein